jgi:ATP-dependent Clp protease adaptor protein ClpS
MDEPAFEDAPTDGTATIVRPERPPKKEKKKYKIPRYHVILWNDDDHSYDYVIRMLKELFGHPEATGFKLAQTVDSEGKVVVLTTTKEHAELKRDQIHAYGKDELIATSQGSMSASIEETD